MFGCIYIIFPYLCPIIIITEIVEPDMIKRVVKVLWIFIALIALTCVIIFFSIAKGWIGYMPPVEDLENPNYKFATEIFSEDGKVLGTYSYSKENRVFVGYNDLSPHIINALIATEDVRFAEHSGIDAIALFRCGEAGIPDGRMPRRQHHSLQLSGQLDAWSADNIMELPVPKPIEWVIAVKLERHYTKEEILYDVSQQARRRTMRRYKTTLYLLRLRAERIKDGGSRHAGGYVQESVALQSGTL